MKTFILGMLSNTSMSEKKCGYLVNCEVCTEPVILDSVHFLEPDVQSEISFILCANCEAMSECKDLYGVEICD